LLQDGAKGFFDDVGAEHLRCLDGPEFGFLLECR
jgi:hypothetical protein